MNKTIEISPVGPAQSELIDALSAAGAIDLELGGDSLTILTSDDAVGRLKSIIFAVFRDAGEPPQIVVRDAETADQGNTWKIKVAPFRAGELWITPPSSDAPDDALIIDAEDSFGSGAHPTTILCLERIAELSPLASFLDAGTGSGILALAALKLGAEHAVGTDPDPKARACAAKNARKNRLSLIVTPEIPQNRRFAALAANIVPAVLIELAPEIVRVLDSRGELMLSGIRRGQEEEVIRTYRELGLRRVGGGERGEWARLDFIAGW